MTAGRSVGDSAPPSALLPPELPALHRSFDTCSRASQRRFLGFTRGSLIFMVVAAAAGAITVQDGPDWAAVVAVFALLLAAGLRGILLATHPERDWYDGRAGAESVKTLTWQFAVGGGAFGIDTDDPRGRLVMRFHDLLAIQGGLGRPAAPSDRQLTDWMLRLRTQPLAVRRTTYLAGRLDDQVDWYSAKADNHRRLANVWSWATLALQAIGIAVAILVALGTIDIDLVGLAASAATAATAWLESKDHSHLAEAYARTAHELVLVRDGLPADDDEHRWSEFVADAEAAVSREHTSWLARRRAPRAATA